jgi:cytochrome c oxidase assembly protein subunit 15
VTLIRRLGWVALVLGFGHIVFGAIVRITGSGLGCGEHWPTCQGYLFPPLSRPDLIIEVSHRYFAATLTASILVLLVVAWQRRGEPGVGGRGGVLRPVALGAVLVLAAAVFGAFTVWLALANKMVIVTHLALAMGLLAALMVAIVRAGGPPRIPIFAADAPNASPSRRAAKPDDAWAASPATATATLAAATLVFAALVLGALTANVPGANTSCVGFPFCNGTILPALPSQYLQFIHRIVAYVTFLYVGWMGVALTRRGEKRLAAWARVVLSVIFLQVLVAFAMVTLHLPPVWRSLHEAVGTLAWIVTFSFAYVAHRLAQRGAEPRAAARAATPAGARA